MRASPSPALPSTPGRVVLMRSASTVFGINLPQKPRFGSIRREDGTHRHPRPVVQNFRKMPQRPAYRHGNFRGTKPCLSIICEIHNPPPALSSCKMWAYELRPSHQSRGQPRAPNKTQKTEGTQEVIDSIRSSLKKRANSPLFAALWPLCARRISAFRAVTRKISLES